MSTRALSVSAGVNTFSTLHDREAAALVGRRRYTPAACPGWPGTRGVSASGGSPAWNWPRPTVTGLPNVTPASLSLLPSLEQLRASRGPAFCASSLAALRSSCMRISSLTSSNGRGAAGLYSRMRPAISVFGATSIASVLRLPCIDSGENSACTNLALPSASACACERVMNGVVSTLRSSALPTPARLSACS